MNKKTNVIFLAIAVIAIAWFFMYKSCFLQKDNQALSGRYELLEKDAENLRNKIYSAEKTINAQKVFIDELLSNIRSNKAKISSASDDELAQLEDKYEELIDAYQEYESRNDKKVRQYAVILEDENETQKKDLLNKERLIHVLRDSIQNNNVTIASLQNRIKGLNQVIQKKDAEINSWIQKSKGLEADIARFDRAHKGELERYARERKAELDKMIASNQEEKDEIASQNERLKDETEKIKERNKKLEEQVPNASSLSVTYRNAKGDLVELRGSTSKKSHKNIKEIFVNFQVNTEKYKGDVKFELTLRCVECKNPSKCPNIPIIDRAPITVISKDNLWSECKLTFNPSLSRYCKYKIVVQHGSENIFTDDYIFVTDGFEQ